MIAGWLLIYTHLTTNCHHHPAGEALFDTPCNIGLASVFVLVDYCSAHVTSYGFKMNRWLSGPVQ